MTTRRPVKTTPQGMNTIDLRTTAGKRLQQICKIVIDMGMTTPFWSLDYILKELNDYYNRTQERLHNIGNEEWIMAINIIRTTFGMEAYDYEIDDDGKYWFKEA